MAKRSSISGRRSAWDALRLALLWARKGGVFRNRLAISLNVFHKGIIRKLRQSNQRPRGALVYGDRELSFDETPVIHVKMHRPSSMRFKMPHIPCIKPQVDFDYDFEFDDDEDEVNHEDNKNDDNKACSFLKNGDEELGDEEGLEEDEGIDLKAEQFIAHFYEQMKFQRQISYLKYNDTHTRSSS